MYNNYYPTGAMSDFVGDYDTIEECKQRREKVLETWEYEYYQILDTETKIIVERNSGYKEDQALSLEDLYKECHPYGK